jgi:hypothetical protein
MSRSISLKKRFEVFKRDSFTCQYCSSKPPLVPLEVDHILPICKGGKNDIDNLITACFDCNRGKGGIELNNVPETIVIKIERMALAKKQYKQYLTLLKNQKKIIDSDINQVVNVYECFFLGYTLTEKFKISIKNFISKLDVYDVIDSMEKSCTRVNDKDDAIKYFCGICWNKIKEK